VKRQFATLLALSVVASLFPLGAATAQEAPTGALGSPEVEPNRKVEPVILTADRLPGWFSPAAEGHAYSKDDQQLEGCGAECEGFIGSNYRSAHNGTLLEPPAEAQTGVNVDEIAAYRFEDGEWIEIPVQVDERFPYFLANGRSDFSFYSHTDRELSYEWDMEQWARTAGECFTEFPQSIDREDGHVQLETMQDPVESLDADDEVVFMADDAGEQASGPGPLGAGDTRQEISIVDPRTGERSFVYLFTTPDGSSFGEDHYVTFTRDDNADEWIDKDTFADGSPDNLGSSNTGYGPNLGGTVCTEDKRGPQIDTAPRSTGDRFPRDGLSVSTDTYKWYASGRWMIRSMQVVDPATGEYGPDLIDRWKGRAFQQSPDSSISLVGFEDEQVNWEGNSTTLGWLEGPVRAIREIWGADSGTNVTKTETFYRDAVTYRYRVRVHPIPPDGLYTSWDYNHDVATCYFNESHPECVPVDGQNDDALQIDRMPEEYEQIPCDERVGTPDALPYGGGNNLCIENAYFDATDPRHSKPLANLNWEQVSGAGSAGSLVYMFEMKNAQSLQNPLVVPYYRDDACLDDGTGDNPTPRRWPGEPSFDERVYGEAYDDCVATEPATWSQRQGCFACHGVHYFITGDTDNAFTPLNTTEIDGQQWQWAVPTSAPAAVGAAYANTVKFPLVAVARSQANAEPSPTPTPTETPTEEPSPTPSPSPSGGDDAGNADLPYCDPLDKTLCLLPFPNNFFTKEAATETGVQVNFNPLAMPRNGAEAPEAGGRDEGGVGKPIDPTEWNRNDGFSPGSAVMTYVPGLDLHRTWGTQGLSHSAAAPNEHGYFDHRDHIADIDRYLDNDAPLVIINTETGERHPFWSELDSHPAASEKQLLIMRPARNFEEGTRYVVALRNLKDAQGTTIPPDAAFDALNNNEAGGATDINGRQAYFNEKIFPELAEADIPIARDDLFLAWDFTVASEDNIAGRMLHMRDDAFGRILGDSNLADRLIDGTSPVFVVDSTEDRVDSWTDSRGVSHSVGIKRVRGRIDVPNYLDRIQQTQAQIGPADKNPSVHISEPIDEDTPQTYYDFPAPGSRLLDTDLDGLPDQNPVQPTVKVPFVCDVPQNGARNIPGLYGHGLLGDRDQINDFNKSPRRNGNFLGCAADWWGMSTPDLPTVATILADGSNFPSLPDRAQQGFLNFMFLGRAAVHPDGFATHDAFQQNDQSLIKTADGQDTYLVYDGNSQGGIMGGALVAVSPDISRGILGVLGMNYSTLLNRSVDWEGSFDEMARDPEGAFDDLSGGDVPFRYAAPFYATYQDPAERQVVFGLMQMLWDRGEANGYAHHMTGDPYRNTPSHEVMLQAAWSDHQVANVSAEVEARTIGAPLMDGLAQGRHWALDPSIDIAQYPYSGSDDNGGNGSALIYWDSGNATPPNGNIPPSEGGDPHGHPRDERAASWQEAHFLLTGEMYDVCNGGDYLTRKHPLNKTTGSEKASCIEPSFPAGSDPDSDDDGFFDDVDNCPTNANPGQEDTDEDGVGDACEEVDPPVDGDGDGVPDEADNCPNNSNPGQEDTDEDGVGDACEEVDPPVDGDGDGVPDEADNCPNNANTQQADQDEDGTGDACDDDADGDDVDDSTDNCAGTYNPAQVDSDGDTEGDGCDSDDDADGVDDGVDNCENKSNPDQADTDGDGIGDACEGDRDSDGVDDNTDNCADNANIGQTDTDEDGLGDACDDDDDGDAVPDDVDNCRTVANTDQDDADDDNIGDACEVDSDHDGTIDDDDNCPDVGNADQADANNDGQGDACEPDGDSDGVADDADNCPTVANANQLNTYGDNRGDACEPNNSGNGNGNGNGGSNGNGNNNGSGGSNGGNGGNGGGGSEPNTQPSSEPTNPPVVQRGQATPSIAASSTRANYGKPFSLSGTVAATGACGTDLAVDIQRRVFGSDSYETIATMDVNGDRSWSYTALTDKSASYVAVVRSTRSCDGQGSTPIDVLVKAKIKTLSLPRYCAGAIDGRVLPAGQGRVALQRKVKGTWTKVGTDKLDGQSEFTLTARGCGLYRIIYNGDTTNEATIKALRLRG
jgi:hypothetical protein